MFRVGAEHENGPDDEAAVALITQCRRLSARLLLVAIVLAIGAGAASVELVVSDYGGPGGKYLGARIGWSFVVGAGLLFWVALIARAWIVRKAISRSIEVFVSRGVKRAGLTEAVLPFLPTAKFGRFWKGFSRSFDHGVSDGSITGMAGLPPIVTKRRRDVGERDGDE
jgi:hypothetical protein